MVECLLSFQRKQRQLRPARYHLQAGRKMTRFPYMVLSCIVWDSPYQGDRPFSSPAFLYQSSCHFNTIHYMPIPPRLSIGIRGLFHWLTIPAVCILARKKPLELHMTVPKAFLQINRSYPYNLNLLIASCMSDARLASACDAAAISSFEADCSSVEAEIVLV